MIESCPGSGPWSHLLQGVMAVFVVVTLFATLFLAQGCDRHEPPEVEIAKMVEAAEEAAEARDPAVIKSMIAEDYRDESGRDRRQVMRIVVGYIVRNRNIHLLTRLASVECADMGGEARAGRAANCDAVVFLAMAGQPVHSPEDLREIRADLYRLDLKLRQDPSSTHGWQVTAAQWRPAVPDDFLPPEVTRFLEEAASTGR